MSHDFPLALQVASVRDLSPSVREIAFDAPAGLSFTPGAHLRLQVRLPDGRRDLRRYSLIGLPRPGQPWRIAVKGVAASRGGSVFMRGLAAGDRVAAQAPANHFELPPGRRTTWIVAGGIGITPLVGHALTLAAHDTRMDYAVRDERDLVFADTLRAALGDRLVTHAGSRGQRLDIAARIAQLPADAQVLACGPVRLLEALRDAWGDAGRPPQRLRFETFGTSGHAEAEPFWVKLPRHGLEFTVGADRSLLDALAERGVACLADCLRGECGLCCVDVLEVHGRIDHRDVFMTREEQRRNDRLCACVSRVAGGGIVIDSAWRPDT
ncbi:MAG TPA: PDR/VanB family oxidoreductase [Burkholderiaceae bacterium]|nr:PDR/VanB family oxidoreductase [Burkholderiaceae bacterium]